MSTFIEYKKICYDKKINMKKYDILFSRTQYNSHNSSFNVIRCIKVLGNLYNNMNKKKHVDKKNKNSVGSKLKLQLAWNKNKI